MAKLYQHKNDGTHYTKVYRGGIVTLQIHPLGVNFLRAMRCEVGDEIAPELMRTLSDSNWLFTKEEMHGMGMVEWDSNAVWTGSSTSSRSRPAQLVPSGRSHRARDGDEAIIELMARYGAWALVVSHILSGDNGEHPHDELRSAAHRLKQIARKLEAPGALPSKFWGTFHELEAVLYQAMSKMSLIALVELSDAVGRIPPLPINAIDIEQRRDVSMRIHNLEQAIKRWITVRTRYPAERAPSPSSDPGKSTARDESIPGVSDAVVVKSPEHGPSGGAPAVL